MAPSFPLAYSDPRKQLEYRASPTPGPAPATLNYEWLQPGSNGRPPQARLAGRLILSPTLRLKGQVSVTARMDRIGLLLMTREPLPSPKASAFLHKLLGTKVYLQRKRRATDGSAQSFLLIQDVTPEALQKVLEVIDSRWGLRQDPDLLLLELALDFQPRASLTPDRQLQLREQLTGLLQRHHHLDGARFFAFPGSDARVYRSFPVAKGSQKGETARLFGTPKTARRTVPDHEISFEEVRQRLKVQTRAPRFFLDTSLYKGSEEEQLLLRLYTKIKDAQVPLAGSYRSLPITERRVRLEVDIRGEALLRHLGLRTASQLGGYDFRRPQKLFFQFHLPTAPDTPVAKRLLFDEFALRGLYGVEAKERLRRAETKTTTQGRRGAGSFGTNVAWTEAQEAVRKAIGALSRRWRSFTWSLPRPASSASAGSLPRPARLPAKLSAFRGSPL